MPGVLLMNRADLAKRKPAWAYWLIPRASIGQNRRDIAVAHAEDAVVQVHGGIAVRNDEFKPFP